MSEIDEQIKRIKEKLQEYKGPERIRPCLSEQEVADFEAEYGVRLPEEYRRFLLEIGNGETYMPRGPDGAEYGTTCLAFGIKPRAAQIWPLQSLEIYWSNLAKPFLQKDPICWEGVELTEDEKAQVEHLDWGNLYVSDYGCAMDRHLIVTGPERGNMWEICDVGSGPLNECVNEFGPPVKFLTWYEELVDERLEGQRKHGLRSMYGSYYYLAFPHGIEELKPLS